MSTPEQFLRAALDSDTPFDSALDLAKQLRNEGMNAQALHELFSAELERHRNSEDERKWNAIADTLDFIVGWCPPGHA